MQTLLSSKFCYKLISAHVLPTYLGVTPEPAISVGYALISFSKVIYLANVREFRF